MGLKYLLLCILVNLPKSKPIDTREEVAKAIGMSGKTYDKLKTISKKNPDALGKIDKGKKHRVKYYE